ncbi:MAG TPA: hypothetical protein VGB87_16295 [Vicinamibacteria bacterium]
MALVWLLLLVGSELAGHPPQAATAAGGPPASPAVTKARGLPAATPLGVAPLSGTVGASAPEAGPAAPRRSVCPMPVIEVDASFDRVFVRGLPPGPPDPIVRDDLSGCGN